MSQDLRAEVTAARGFAQVLRYQCRDRLDKQGQEYLRQITLAADRLDRLIHQTLNLGRGTPGTTPPVDTPHLLLRKRTIDPLCGFIGRPSIDF